MITVLFVILRWSKTPTRTIILDSLLQGNATRSVIVILEVSQLKNISSGSYLTRKERTTVRVIPVETGIYNPTIVDSFFLHRNDTQNDMNIKKKTAKE